MDPPVAVMTTSSSSSLHEPQATPSTGAAPSFSLIDQLLFFDAFGDDATAAPFTPLGTTLSSASIPAHDALMAFLAEMDALDRENDDDEQESVTSSTAYSSDTETASTITTAAITSEISTAAEVDGARGDLDDEVMVVVQQQTHGEAQSAVVAPIATAKAASPVKKKRIRAKHEIDMLREDSVALQRRLEMLQSNATNKQKREHATKQEDSTMKRKKTKLRHAGAVEQNRQLRKMVKTQLRYAKQIESLLTSQSNDEEDRNILISDNAVMQTPLSKADLVVFYEAMTGKLDTLYTQLDDAFADVNPKGATDFNDVKLVIDDDKHSRLQLRDVKILPFDFESVQDVTWRMLKAQSVKEGDGADELLVADKDVMLMRRALTVQLNKGEPEVEIPMRAVSKRFLSKGRMVFCWDGTTDWPIQPKAGKPGPQSVPLREKGWAVIKPVPGTIGLCTIQMCILMTPGVADERMYAQTTRQEIEEGMTKFVIPTYQQLFASRYQMVENMLLDEQKR